MAKLTKSYTAKGILSLADMELTEIKKEAILVHDLNNALRNFEGLDVTVTIKYDEEIAPKGDEEKEDENDEE